MKLAGIKHGHFIMRDPENSAHVYRWDRLLEEAQDFGDEPACGAELDTGWAEMDISGWMMLYQVSVDDSYDQSCVDAVVRVVNKGDEWHSLKPHLAEFYENYRPYKGGNELRHEEVFHDFGRRHWDRTVIA